MKNIIFITAVAGVGKTTVCEYLKQTDLLEKYEIYDIDDFENINDYTNDTYNLFYENAIKKAIIKSKEKDIIMASSINPTDIERINLPEKFNKISVIAITCSNEALYKRLKMRNPERNCGSDEFINSQINYQNWILDHINLYQLHLDNTNSKIDETSSLIIEYIKNNLDKQ